MRLQDYSDRDLLGLLNDLGDQEGWCLTHDVAIQTFGTAIDNDDNRREHAERCVGIRLSWMRRYGVVDAHPEKKKMWRLSRVGYALLEGNLTAKQETALAGARDEQLLFLATAFGERYMTADSVGATMMRRAWQYAAGRRRR